MSISTKLKSELRESKFLAKGLCRFFENNTGRTDDYTDHYIINPEGVICNNRHLTCKTMMEGQPDGDATTEGQSILIQGFIEMYKGTKDTYYLDKAEYFWEAYIKYFYQRDPDNLPQTPQRMVCNWIVNGKQPVLADYPIDHNIPTHSGTLSQVLTYENGITKVPEEYFGQYLDRATFAYEGKLLWNTIVADVVAYKEDGVTVDYKTAGTKYEVDWIIDYLGRKVNSDGDILEENLTDIGTIALKDTTVNGDYKTCFATKVPVEEGGYMIGRNEPYHNRPLQIPVIPSTYGNAADAEQWFYLCTKDLYEITGKERYKRCLDCVKFTLRELIDVDKYMKFFRRSVSASPFTDGVSYDYGNTATYTRDDNKYIIMDCSGYHGVEQSQVKYKVNQDSILHVQCQQLPINNVKSNDLGLYAVLELENKGKIEIKMRDTLEHNYKLSDFYTVSGNSKDADPDEIDVWSGVTKYGYFDDDIHRNAVEIRFGDDGGSDITNRNTPLMIVDNALWYKSDVDLMARIVDDHNMKYFTVLPKTDTLTQYVFDFSKFTLKRWGNTDEMETLVTQTEAEIDQGKYAERWSYYKNLGLSDRDAICELLVNDLGYQCSLTEKNGLVDYITLELNNSTDRGTFYYYGFGDYDYNTSPFVDYTSKFTLEFKSEDNPYKVQIGDCEIKDYMNDNLAYTPGIIPYSNIYNFDTVEIDFWHGCPFTGYQVPRIYDESETIYLHNIIQFMCDAQDQYYEKFGTLGPLYQTYVWNRSDCLVYGDADTFIMEQWYGHGWDGYIARSFYQMCDLYNSLSTENPDFNKVKTFCFNFTNFLKSYYDAHGEAPNTFNADGTIEVDGYTQHMPPLYLSGVCRMIMKDTVNNNKNVESLSELAQLLFREIKSHYTRFDHSQIMNGAWSPAPREWSGEGAKCNGMFYGFHGGEILRALGLALQLE